MLLCFGHGKQKRLLSCLSFNLKYK